MQTFLRTVATRRRLRGDRRRRRVLPRVRRHGSGLPRRARSRSRSCSPTPDTAFVLVTSPRRDALEEARVLRASGSSEHGQQVDALIVNRVHPTFGDEAPDGPARRAPTTLRAERRRERRRAGRAARRALREPRRLPRDRRRSSASTSTACTSSVGVGVDRVRAVPRPRRLRLRRARRDRQAAVRRSPATELA